jgi:UDP-N-acetylmuramoylalanine--D-glutamate ligase
MFPARTFKDKRVAVFGLARSGISCAQALIAGGAEVLAWDDSDPAVVQAREAGVPIVNLHQVDFATADSLVLSPGVPFTHPEPHWTVVKAKTAGIEIIGDTEVFVRQIAGTGARLVGITGTNGKSTTTALIAHVLRAGGLDVEMGGNIGKAVFNLGAPRAGCIYVVELSSYQIELTPSLKPSVGVLTNITPDHLDRHGTMENYASVKGRMFARQSPGDLAVIGVDDKWSKGIASSLQAGVTLQRVSVTQDLPADIRVHAGMLIEDRNRIDLRGMASLRGAHNWQNAAMAYGTAKYFGMTNEIIAAAMQSFPGLAHRMQQVARLGDTIFINDSKATNADAAEKALQSFDHIYWIAGGLAKSGGIEPLARYFPKIKHAYLIGVAADQFAEILGQAVPFTRCGTLDHAVADAARDTKGSTAAIVFSPACASFDQYKNFEVRGDHFVQLVSKLDGITMMQGVTA